MSPERWLDFEMGETGKQEVSKQKRSNDRTDPYPTFTLGQRCSLVGFLTDRQVLDHHESMALVARSRTITVGRESTNGSVDGNNDLDGAYNFAGDHSAQWNRVIQDLKPFFNRMLKEHSIPSNP